MIIEQELEQAVINAIKEKLLEKDINTISVKGMLQTSDTKGLEKDEKEGYIFVKATPRQYSTSTVPECQINIRIVLTLRSDIDYNGSTYVDVFETLIDLFERWQKCLSDVHNLFNIENRFNCTGYQLSSGDTSTDTSKTIWAYSHDMIIYGVVLNS